MSSPGDLLGVHQPGTTILHRAPASVKLVVLALVSIATVVVDTPVSTTAALVGALVLLAIARVRIWPVLASMRGLLVMLVLLGAWQVWQQGLVRAFTIVGGLVALILLAAVLTVTTSVDELLDTITRALGPFRRFGVNPEVVALAFSLMIRAIPTTITIATETRQAAKARGLERNPRAMLTPMVIRMVAHARATGDALHARGVGDDLAAGSGDVPAASDDTSPDR